MSPIEDLILRGSSLPLDNYPGFSRDQATEYMLHRLKAVNGEICGDFKNCAGFLVGLSWDSSMLGLSCGRIDFASALDTNSAHELAQSAAKIANAQDIRHLSARFDIRDSNLIEAFQANGFVKVDSISTYTLQVNEDTRTSSQDTVRIAQPIDAEQVAEISRVAFTVDRFHSDPLISKELADNLHAEWGRNSVLGKAADVVIVAFDREKVLSFVTCKINQDLYNLTGYKLGTIVLVATAPEAQGQGLGKATVKGALNWFAEQGCHCVEVGTQSSNTGAKKLYESLGFRPSASWTSLRCWITKD